MSAISTLRGNYGPQSAELVQLNREYQSLSKTQNEALNAGTQLKEGNNKLATSFENLSKRVIFYSGLGAITGFVTQLFSIRGEYEMLERSMGAILGSFQEGSKIFNQIQQQALQSPMTVIDLSDAAKQLIAYNFSMNEVAITTKKMADISSALGVPMERMTYNLGQIKAQGFLTARDARDFANAGLAVVPKLAEMYTNLNGKVVTTSDVYDMLTKKMVPYADVMKVINGLTDEGGMFFDFQAKQAETLKGQLSNLVDAWNMMLNQIGQSNEGIMKGSVSAMRELFTNWRTIESTIEGVVVAYGMYKAAQIIANATMGQSNLGLTGLIGSENRHRLAMLQRTAVLRELTAKEQAEVNTYTRKSTLFGAVTWMTKASTAADYQAMFAKNGLTTSQARWMVGLGLTNDKMKAAIVNMKLMTTQEITALSGTKRFATGLKLLKVSLKELGLSIMSMMPQMAAMIAITALTSWWSESNQRAEEQADLNRSIAEQSKQTIDDLNQYLKDNQPTIAVAQKGNMNNNDSLKLWDNLKEEIQKTSGASDYFIAKLLDINNIQSRNKAAIEYIKMLRDTAEAMKGVADVDITTTDSGPWGLFGDGMVSKLKNYSSALKEAKESYNDYVANTKNAPSFSDYTTGGYGLDVANLEKTRNEAQGEIDKSLKLMEQSVNERGIYLDKDKNKFIEAMSQEVAAVKKAHPEIQGAMAEMLDNGLDKKLGTHEAAWSKFMDVLKNTSSASFSDITTDGLEQWDGYNSKSNKKMDQGIKAALKSIQKSSPDFYNEVYRIIQNAPDFKIRIGLAFNVNQMGDFQKDFSNRLNKQVPAWSKDFGKLTVYQPNGNEDISEWKKRQQGVISKNNAIIKDLDKKPTAISKKTVSNLTEENRLIAEALSLFGLSAESDKNLAKQQKQRNTAYKKQLSEEAQAIKNEIDLIDKLSSNYDKLTQKGMQNGEAVKLLSKEYQSSIGGIDKVLGKYGIPKFDIKQFVGNDASGQLNYLEKLRDTMKSKGLDRLKPDAYKEVSVQIQKLSVDAKTYDLTNITDGLKEQLNSIKESYQLGKDIKDNPEQWNLLSNILQVTPDDVNNIVVTAKEASLKIQDEIDNVIKNYNSKNKTSLNGYSIYFSDSDKNKWMKQNDFSKDNDLTKSLNAARKEAQDILTKDYSQNVKSWDDLLSKYAEYEYKRNEIQKTAAKERLNLIQSYGISDEYKQALDLANQIRISDDSETVNRLQKQLAILTEKVASKNDKAKAISVSISQKIKSDQGSLDWDKFTKSDLYQKAFEEMDRVSVSSLKDIMSEMDRLKETSDITFSPEQMKAYSKAYKQVRDALETRAPFETIVSSMKAWIQATKDKKKADEDLILAENELTTAKKRLDILKSVSLNNDKKNADITNANNEAILKSQNALIQAEKNLKKARDNKADATDKAADAETSFRKALSSSQQALSQSASLLSQFMDLFDIDKESKFGQGLSALVKGLNLIATALGIIVTVAILAKLSLGWVAVIGAALAVIIGALTWIGGKKDTYSGLKKSVDNLSDAIDKASSKMTQLLETATGEKAMSYYKQLIKNNDDIIQSYRDLAKAAGESGSSWGSHSYAYRTNKALKHDWESISNVVGVSVSKVQDLYNLSAAQLELLRTQMPVAWSNISSDIRTALEGIITYGDKADDYVNDLATSLTDVKFDDLTSSFKDMLSDLDTSTKDWADKFESMVRSAIIRSVVYGEDFQAGIKSLLAEMAKDMSSGGELTKDEKDVLHKQYMDLVAMGKSKAEAAEEIAGISTTSTSSLSSLQQGIQNMTEDTGGALEASLNGISGQVYSQTNILQNLLNNSNVSLGTQSQILLQMRESYQIQKSIQSILTGWSNNSGRAIMVELTK